MERIDFKLLYRLSDQSMNEVLDFCMALGVISSCYECPKCRKQMKLVPRGNFSDIFEWSCRLRSVPAHRVKRSIRSGSWFSGSRMSIIDILLLTHYFVRNISQNVIMEELKMSSGTITDWRSFFRGVCFEACLKMNEPIGGEGLIVEIDGIKSEKRKDSGGQSLEGRWVFAGIERDSNKCFFKVVNNKEKSTFLNIVKTYVLPGSTIQSDYCKPQNCLKDEELRLLAVDRSLDFKEPDNDSAWAAFKKAVPARTVKDQFDTYLAEYMWRRHNSNADDLTRVFFEDVKSVYPPRNRDAPSGEIKSCGDD